MNAYHKPEGGSLELYLAQFKDLEATLIQSDGPGETFSLGGEILITVQLEEDKPVVAVFRRVSLWIENVETLGGQTAFAGPINKLAFDPALTGTVEPFDVRFYYTRLGDLGPACREIDAAYPRLETLRGRLAWETEGSEGNVLKLRIEILLDNLIESYLGAVKGLAFGPVSLDFRRLEAQIHDAPQANSLTACTSSAPLGRDHDQLALKLRFVTLSGLHTGAASVVDPTTGETLEDIVKRQIAGACRVWWDKGGLKINPEASITAQTTNVGVSFNVSTIAQENSLFNTQAVADAVEVYLVDGLGSANNLHPGGGITHRCNSSDAYIILEITKAQNNPYLLAHEIGHVLGLAHPDGPSGSDCPAVRNGSYCSVMVPDSPNSSRNPDNNLQVLDPAPPLGMVLTSLGAQCTWDGDLEQGFFHFVRDFPSDDGTEDSVPQPPAQYWWTHSDVWNSSSITAVFNPDHSPVHEEPMRSAIITITNHMFVRVHTCQRLLDATSNPVQAHVHLLLAVPGSADRGLERITPPGGLPIQFPAPFPEPGDPVVLIQNWAVPPGYPPDCCVFAVVESSLDPLPADVANAIANPTAPNSTFYTLFDHLKSDNDIAQRNLHIQEVAPFMRASQTTLNWIQVDNPFEQSAPASLEVDSRLADGLLSLAVEVNGIQVKEINLGSVERIELDKALSPGEHLVVRLRAQMPSGLSRGTSFPIALGIFVGARQVSGFQHLLHVSSLFRATIQTLDWLYAALEDVAIISQSRTAHRLVKNLGIILWREARHIKPPAGCLFWLWKLLGLRTSTWITELKLLSKNTGELGRYLLEPGRGQEYQALGELILRLASLFQSGDTIPPEQFVEQLRDLADNIQARAGSRLRMSVT